MIFWQRQRRRLEKNESIANASQSTTLAGVTLNSGANATLSSGPVRGSNDTGYMALGTNIVRNVGSSLDINFIIKGGVANNGVYFHHHRSRDERPDTQLPAGRMTARIGLAAQINFNNGNNPGSGLYNYTGYSNNTALATWLPTNNMSVSNSAFALTASASINSLKLSGPATVTITAGQTLTIQNGGLLASSAGVGSSAINGGKLIIARCRCGPDRPPKPSPAVPIASPLAPSSRITVLPPPSLWAAVVASLTILTNNNTYTARHLSINNAQPPDRRRQSGGQHRQLFQRAG